MRDEIQQQPQQPTTVHQAFVGYFIFILYQKYKKKKHKKKQKRKSVRRRMLQINDMHLICRRSGNANQICTLKMNFVDEWLIPSKLLWINY